MSDVKGWACWEDPHGAYEIGTDTDVTHVGKRSGYVASKKEHGAFGTIMQKVDSADYKGQRIQFSAFLKCKDVEKQCGLFMEVFGEGRKNSGLLAVDNMYKRAVTGTQDWTKYALVLDVANDALGINIGCRLVGQGKVWIDGVALEAVSKDVALTDEMPTLSNPSKPQNLSFEEG